MKKMQHAFMAFGIMILAASFFAACPESESDQGSPGDEFPYTLTLREGNAQGSVLVNATRSQGTSISVNRALSNPDGSSVPLSGVSFRFDCLTHAPDPSSVCGITANSTMTTITAAASAAEGDHVCTATAIQNDEPIARANFTVTITLAPYGVIFNPDTIPVKHEDDAGDVVIGSTLTAPNGNIEGLTLSFACTTHTNPVCGLTFTGPNAQSRYVIGRVANTVAVGDHAITVTVNGTPAGTPTVTVPLTVKVVVKYTLTLNGGSGNAGNLFEVTQGDTLDFAECYTLTKSDGTPLESDIKVGIGCNSDYDNCDAILKAPARDWDDLVLEIPANAAADKIHTAMLEAYADNGNGELLADKQVLIKVIGKVAQPVAQPEAGTYNTAQTVTLTSTTPTSPQAPIDIYYTLDGTDPTTASTKYTSAITISATATLKAIAVKPGWTTSEILTATYTIEE